MVLDRKIDHRINGFRVPVIPRAPRSVRRRGPLKRTGESNQICAFELLASLAGKLLEESESSSASSNASEGKVRHGFGRSLIKQEQESPRDVSDPIMECTSVLLSSGCSVKVNSDVKSVNSEKKNVSGEFPHKSEGSSLDCRENCNTNVDRRIGANSCSLKGNITNSCNSAEMPLGRNSVPNASFSRHRNGIELDSRDDDDQNSRFNNSSAKFKPSKLQPQTPDHRMRKLLTSKYWKMAPKLKDSELSDTFKRLHREGRWKAVYHKRKTFYNRERTPQYCVHKKRKLFDQSSMVISDGGLSSESISNSPEKGKTKVKNGSAEDLHGGNGISSSVIGYPSFHTKDSHVKFSIKSFKVPELYIEVPESATVGSLKRTVMEAVTAFLGGKLHVGVLLQGKKVRDDNRTLLQSGITCKENLDTLGFILDPDPVEPPSPLSLEEPPIPCEHPQLFNRSEPSHVLDSGISAALCDATAMPKVVINNENNHGSITSHTDVADKAVTDSRAIVALPPENVEALAVVPVNQKTKRRELVQRRTRRPFSVAEVEALVSAVEELGTGRWRDIKLRAFDNADHRTYVDLKDKWKTLVHTANISPQQRRGEPVPQDLLDRVLAAHARWSQNQAKPHSKHQVGTLKTAAAAKCNTNKVAGI